MFKFNKVWNYLRGRSKPLIAVTVGGLIVVISVVCCRTISKVRSIESLVESECTELDSKGEAIKKEEKKTLKEELKIAYENKRSENWQNKKEIGQTPNPIRSKKKHYYDENDFPSPEEEASTTILSDLESLNSNRKNNKNFAKKQYQTDTDEKNQNGRKGKLLKLAETEKGNDKLFFQIFASMSSEV
jgi:hypothetical protein